MATIVYTLKAGFNINYPYRDETDEDEMEEANENPIAPVITQDELVKRVLDKMKVSHPHLTFDNVKSIFSGSSIIIQERLKLGETININLMHYKLRMTGSFANIKDKFNPEAHRTVIDLTPSAQLLESIRIGGAKLLGVDASEMRVTRILVDIETGTKYIHLSND